VSKSALERMKDRYQKNVTVKLIKDLLNEEPTPREEQRNKVRDDKTKHQPMTKQLPAANNTKLGDLYFDKNYHSPMRVHDPASGKAKAAKSPADFPFVEDIEARQLGRNLTPVSLFLTCYFIEKI